MITLQRLPEKFDFPALSVGVTGGIGSGKTTLMAAFAKLGYPCISADVLAKQLMENDAGIREKIIETFGSNSYKASNPNRVYLADKVFCNEHETLKMNAIVHPAVIKRSMELITELKLKSKLVFYESALLFSAGLHGRFDLIILIESPDDVRFARTIARTGMNASEIEARVKTQKILPDISLNNLIRIDNSADIENLYQDAEAVVRILLEKLKINV